MMRFRSGLLRKFTRTAIWPWAFACLLGALFGSRRQAAAAHLACAEVSHEQVAAGRPLFDASIDFRSAGFSLAGSSGTWHDVGPTISIAPWRWLALSGRIGMAYVAYDARSSESGLTDMETAARARIWGHSRFSVWGGLGAMLPTGSVEKGIGMGHVMLMPFVETNFAVSSRLGLSLRAADLQMIGTHGATAAGGTAHAGHVHGTTGTGAAGPGLSVVTPHAPHEVLVALGASVPLSRVRLGMGAQANIVASDSTSTNLGHGLSGTAQAAIALTDSLGIGVGLGVPLAGDARYRWLGHASLYWLLGQRANSN